MGLIEQDTFICLDCETTGLDAKEDRLIEIGIARFTFGEILETYETLIDPQRLIPQITIDIHHITDEMVKGKPLIKEILPTILKMVGDHIIVGHGIGLDIAFIAEEAKRNQVPCNIESNRSIDTLRMARLYGESPVNSLERLRKHFNIAEEGAHRAMSDVIVNIDVFKYLSERFKTTKDLMRRLEKPILLRTMPLGKHKGRSFSDIPIQYLHWAVNKDFDQDLLFSIRTELKKRKKQANFQQSSNPFGDL